VCKRRHRHFRYARSIRRWTPDRQSWHRGKPASGANIAEAARLATSGAKPLSYKLDLLSGLVRNLMEQLAA